jgi:hypothetical protein
MSKEMTIICLGLFVIVLPYLGIYRSWLTLFMVLTGLILIAIGFLLRGEAMSREHEDDHRSHNHAPNHDSRIGSLN